MIYCYCIEQIDFGIADQAGRMAVQTVADREAQMKEKLFYEVFVTLQHCDRGLPQYSRL